MLSPKAHSPKKRLCARAPAALGLIPCATRDAEKQGAAPILSISPAEDFLHQPGSKAEATLSPDTAPKNKILTV